MLDASLAATPSALPPVQETVDLGTLTNRWRAVACDMLCGGARNLDLGPALPGRIRGAWGHALMQGASLQALAGEPCPWSPPCALDGLFRDQGYLTRGLPVAKPWLIETYPQEDPRLLGLRLVLFGAAADHWMPTAAEALAAAVRQGISTDAGGRVPLEPLDRIVSALPPPPLPDVTPEAVVLRFRTPVVQRRGAVPGLDPVSLLTGLGNRLGGLTRWMGLDLRADWTALKASAGSLQSVMSGLSPVTWRRLSNRQGGREVPMAGFLGDLTLSGPLEPVMPLLALGAQAHAGSHASLGLGAYDLLVQA